MAETATTVDKDKKQRSPSYPFISLEQAVERARKLWAKENNHAATVSDAAKHWGYKAKSSGALLTISALKQFNLAEVVGSGAGRKVRLTALAKRILLDEIKDSPSRVTAIKEAALGPKLYAELFNKWGASSLPSDESFRTYLRLDRGFNETVIQTVMTDYKATLSFAKLSDSDKMSPAVEDKDDRFNTAGGHMEGTPQPKPSSGQDGVLSLSVPYGAKGSVLTVQVKLAGERLKPAHIAKVRRYLELAESDLTEDAGDE
jgi:hypothetical protein